ncbi:MAG: hypothetical protein JWN04_3958 [Myxococcaceae bacterium]|nr:hypothetical protein [Myxococcaceae bacterium]
MGHSFAKVRRGAAALLLAGGVATSACGDDSGGTTPPVDSGAKADSGSDARVRTVTPDSGPITTIGDAGTTELAKALSPTGVDTSGRRADLVFAASCQRGKECDDPEWSATCVSEGRDDYQVGVDGHYSDACLDSTLDRVACFATVATCDDYFGDGCDDLSATSDTACAPYESAGDGGV